MFKFTVHLLADIDQPRTLCGKSPGIGVFATPDRKIFRESAQPCQACKTALALSSAAPVVGCQLHWFIAGGAEDGQYLKAEPFEDGSGAFWIQNDGFSGSGWTAGFGKKELGKFDSLPQAITACEKVAAEHYARVSR
jgi:hypothetical protein